MYINEQESRYRCIFTPKESEDFNFFPVSFFFYCLFQIFLCGVIITKCIILDTDFTDDHFIENYHQQSPLPLTHNTIIHTNNTFILDLILIYSIMILSLWESFFSFYRYYTTLDATTYYQRPSICSVFGKFSFYMLIFIASFLCEVHATYFMFPFVIILYTAFNTFCTFKFASLLITRYRLFITMGGSQHDKDILSSVYFMRKTSLICTVIQSLSLGVFVVSYNVDIIYYLPVLWSLSSILFTMNFVRNRHSLKNFAYAIFWKCRYAHCCTSIEAEIQQKREQNRRAQSQKEKMRQFKERNEINNDVQNDENNEKIQDIKIEIEAKEEEIIRKQPSMLATKVGSNSLPTEISTQYVPDTGANKPKSVKLPPNMPNMKSSQSAMLQRSLTTKMIRSRTPMPSGSRKRTKAFAFLGLTENLLTTTNDTEVDDDDDALHKRAKTLKDKEEVLPHSPLELDIHSTSLPNIDNQYKSDHQITFDIDNSRMMNLNIKVEDFDESQQEMSKNNHLHITPGTTPLYLAKGKVANSLPIPNENGQNDNKTRTLDDDKNAHSVPIPEKEENEIEKSMTSLATPSTPMDMDDVDSFIYLGLDEEAKASTSRFHIDVDLNQMMQKSEMKRAASTTPIIPGSKRTSLTAHADIGGIDLEKVCKSLQILVDYGFCSRVSMNNIKQLQRYREQTLVQIEQTQQVQMIRSNTGLPVSAPTGQKMKMPNAK